MKLRDLRRAHRGETTHVVLFFEGPGSRIGFSRMGPMVSSTPRGLKLGSPSKGLLNEALDNEAWLGSGGAKSDGMLADV